MKIVRLSQDSNLTRIEKVFKWNRFSGRGPAGPTTAQAVGDVIAAAEKKTELVDADGIGASNSEDGDILVEWTYGSLKAQLTTFFTGVFDLIYAKIFNIKNWETIAGATVLNATSYSTQTADFTASFTATLEGFTSSRQSITFEFVVASGTPTMTLAGSIFKFYTTLNLTTLAAGSYVAYFKSSDSGVNTKVFVKLAP